MQSHHLQLTPPQVNFLNSLLPTGFSLQLSTLDVKRVRTAKKIDQSFTTEYVLPPKRKPQIQDKEQPAAIQKQRERDPHLQTDHADSPIKYQTIVPAKKQDEKAVSRSTSELMMGNFLLRLKMHKSSWPFRMPVDPVTQAVPNYYQVVKQPMDLKTIDRKIKSHQYQSQKDFDADIRKIIANSYVFNSQDTVYYTLTKEFQNYYEELWVEYRKNPEAFLIALPERRDKLETEEYSQKMQTKTDTASKKKAVVRQSQSEIKKAEETAPVARQEPKEKQMLNRERSMNTLGFKQREKLFHKIQNLSQEGIKNLLKLLCGSSLRGDWQEVELDLAELGEQKFKKLQLFLSQNGS